MKKKKKDLFPQYLRRVGRDYAKSGSESTAQDYFEAADRIEALEREVRALKHLLKAAKKMHDVTHEHEKENP